MNKNTRGTLLVLAVAVVFIVGGMVASILTLSTAGVKRERGLEQKFKSREIAEAGLDVSLNELRKATDARDNDGDGAIDEGVNAQTGPFGHYTPSGVVQVEGNLGRLGTINWTPSYDANGNGLPDFNEPGVTPINFSGGRFIVWTIFSEADGLDNDGNGTVDEVAEAGSLTAIAISEYGTQIAQSRFSGLFTDMLTPPNPPLWNPNAAIGVGGSLTVTGSADVTGTQGNVHANQFLNVQGSANISGNATASGGASVSNPGSVGGLINGSAGMMGIPDVRPAAFKPLADYIMKNNGDIVNRNGVKVNIGNGNNNPFSGFSFNAADQSWNVSGGDVTMQGTFYVEGGLRLAGGGNPNGPVKVASFIAEKSIQVSGNMHFTPNAGSLWLVSGGDVKITGNPNQVHEGIVLAREQIFIAGNPELRGVVMGADLDNIESLATENFITGSMSIQYNGGLTTNIPVIVPSTKYILDPTFSAYEER